MRQWLLAISANIVGTAIVLALIIIGLTINSPRRRANRSAQRHGHGRRAADLD